MKQSDGGVAVRGILRTQKNRIFSGIVACAPGAYCRRSPL